MPVAPTFDPRRLLVQHERPVRSGPPLNEPRSTMRKTPDFRLIFAAGALVASACGGVSQEDYFDAPTPKRVQTGGAGGMSPAVGGGAGSSAAAAGGTGGTTSGSGAAPSAGGGVAAGGSGSTAASGGTSSGDGGSGDTGAGNAPSSG